jgi:hypothetical protein
MSTSDFPHVFLPVEVSFSGKNFRKISHVGGPSSYCVVASASHWIRENVLKRKDRAYNSINKTFWRLILYQVFDNGGIWFRFLRLFASIHRSFFWIREAFFKKKERWYFFNLSKRMKWLQNYWNWTMFWVIETKTLNQNFRFNNPKHCTISMILESFYSSRWVKKKERWHFL